MRLSVSTKYAIRSLTRHRRRTILSVAGIGLGCAVCLFVIGFVRGESKMFIRAAAESGAGHLRVVPARWIDTRENDLRLPEWKETLKMLRSTVGLAVATPRARTDALLAFGTRAIGVEIVGVDPTSEQAANRLVRNVVEGRYLKPGETGTTVIGRAIAKRLDVELDDELMLTAARKDGEMGSAMLGIVGIVETGSSELDATICHVNLEDVERISGLSGAGELTILVKNAKKLNRLAASLREKIPRGEAVVTWREIKPELASGVKVDETWTNLTVAIVMIVVFLGIASAQLAAVLERRREFAVLAALGMKNRRLVHSMLTEGLALGLLGAAVGLMIGVPATYLVATKGVDFSSLYGSDITMSNVLVDPVFYGDFGWWLLPLAFGLSLTATVVSSLYPAWYAVRTDPATALRVEH